MSDPTPVSPLDLLRWAEALAGVARTGLGFTQNLYERERFEEVLRIAADIRCAAIEEVEAAALGARGVPEMIVEEWLGSVGQGVPGYVTPKTVVGAVVGNEAGEILLVKRAGQGVWLYPTGWADVGYSPSEVAVKEVFEETGIEVEPVSLIGVFDGMRLGFTHVPLYSLVFFCKMTGGALRGHPLETEAVGFFPRDRLPEPLAGSARWVDLAFAAIGGQHVDCVFDPPRIPPWRVPPDG